MDAKLKERAQKVAQLRHSNQRFTDAQFREIGEVHHLLTGRNVRCISCNVYGLLNDINSTLIKEPLIITDMAKAHFKAEFENAQVIRHTKNGTVVITSKNLNEGDNLRFVAEEGFGHLLTESKATTEAVAASQPNKTSSKKKKKAAAAKAAEVKPAGTTTEPTTDSE